MNKYKQIAAPFKICVDTEYNLEKKNNIIDWDKKNFIYWKISKSYSL